jgi:hypothetical protein
VERFEQSVFVVDDEPWDLDGSNELLPGGMSEYINSHWILYGLLQSN